MQISSRAWIAAATLMAALPLTASTGSAGASSGPAVVISELMINPHDVFDSRGEWIELTNVGDQSADLAGWTLTDGRQENVTLPDLSVAPGARIVLARNGDSDVNGGAEAAWVYGNQIVLYNPMDRLVLSDASGVEQDRVDWYPTSGLSVPEGRSLSRDPATLTPGATASWCAATTIMRRGDLGSPGAENTCTTSSANVVISEILQNPRRSSDFEGEFFEVHNRGATVVDLNGWTVKDDDHDRFVIDASVEVVPGGYAVLGIGSSDNGGVALDHAYGDAMRLHNDADELVLAEPNGILVDRVAWDDGRTFPDPNGASMALIDPATDNADGANWCTSTTPWAYGDLGTPGSATWCTPNGANPIVVTEVMFDPQVPLSERPAEWFEIANLGSESVDLAGWTVTAGDWKVHTIDALVVGPGEVAVLAASSDRERNGDVGVEYEYGGELPLYNRIGRLILKDAAGAIVDRVEWSANNGFPMPTGRSITLGSPTSNNALGPNWCVSTSRWAEGDFGTPGSLGDCVAPPAAPALRISEIMRNPAAVRDSVGEWFEVFNSTSTDVDLRGWAFGDDDSDLHLIRRSLVVPAGQRLVLGRSTDAEVNGGAPVSYSYGDSVVLSNRADELVLVDQYGQYVDAVRWDSGAEWFRPNGASMTLLDGQWCISGPQFGKGDLGTPGSANDCTPLPHADVVISEIHLDPAAVSDTIGEWIEITNAGNAPVDIDGWKLRDDDADRHTIRADGSWVIAPGESVVLGRERSPAINGRAPVDYEYGSSFPITNSVDEIMLLDADGVWVDRVAWSSGRKLPASSGVSASLRSLDLDNGDPANWCASVTPYADDGDLGTPGQPNVCEVSPPPTTTTTTTTTTSTTTPATTTTTMPPVDPFVRITFMCVATQDGFPTNFGGDLEVDNGDFVFRIRHESGHGPLGYAVSRTDHRGRIAVGETQFVVLPEGAGYRVLPDGEPEWSNRYGGTASTNTTQRCSFPEPAVDDRPFTAGFGVLAVGPCSTSITGSSVTIDGGVRSNGDLTLQGSTMGIDGPVSHAGNGNISHLIDPATVVQNATPVEPELPWTEATLQAQAAEIHIGKWKVGKQPVQAGLHFVYGDVQISGSKVDLTGVSIVATGTIKVSGATALSPADPSLPTLVSYAGSCSEQAINLSGSSISWSGVIAAPLGKVQVNGSSHRGGTVLGAAVQMSGSDIEIG